MPSAFFVQTSKDHLTIDGRVYPKGSVVEVDKYKHDELVKHEAAITHTGPAFEPEPSAEDEPRKQLRQRVIEKATKL